MSRKNILLIISILMYTSITAQNITWQPSKNYQFNKAVVDSQLVSYTVFRADMSGVAALQNGLNDQIEKLNFQFNVGQFTTTFYLTNSHIIVQDYKRRTSSGRIIASPTPSLMEGYTAEGHEIRVTLNTHYLHGFIKTGDTRYYIEPLWKFDEDAASDLYLIYDIHDFITREVGTCATVAPPRFNKDKPEPRLEMRAGNCYDVEYALATDYEMYMDYGSVSAVENQILSVLNDMQTNYDDEFSDNLNYVIVETYIVDCRGCDPWTSSTDPGTLLNDFSQWGGTGFSQNHDVASLWTNRDFDGNTVGIAWLDVLCQYGYKYNCLQDFSTNADYLRVLNSHELGHNWSAVHDPSGSPYIMAPSVSNVNAWSSASQNSINNEITTSVNNGCVVSCAPLPVTLLSFNTACERRVVNLHWITSAERNNDYFAIERSVDGKNWKVIGTVNGVGNSNTIQEYSYTDYPYGILNAAQVYYYRLKQVDYDGEYELSDIVLTHCSSERFKSIQVIPNPGKGDFIIRGLRENCELIVLNNCGEIIFRQKMAYNYVKINIRDEPVGVYFLLVNSDQGTRTKKILVSR